MKPRQYTFRHACGALFACAPWLALLLACGTSHAQALTPDGEDFGQDHVPVVITPTRLRQSLADVPASVTVISSETIRRYGLANIGDILRLVPGMAVSQTFGTDLRVNYHGTYAISPRRMNVLVDGVSIYRPAFSRVEWLMLPIALEDIDHIEVIRGPDSSAYGPNSMTAIINIFSRHPKDVEPVTGVLSVGTHNEVGLTARTAATVGGTAIRLTADSGRHSGYDNVDKFGNHDSSSVKRLNVRAQRDLAEGESLDVQASYVESSVGMNRFESYQLNYPDQQRKEAQWSAKWTTALSATHDLHLEMFQAYASNDNRWRSRPPAFSLLPQMYALEVANQAYSTQLRNNLLKGIIALPPGGSPQDQLLATQAIQAALALPFVYTEGTVNQDGTESRTQLELQDTYVFSNDLRMVSGMGMRHQWVWSDTYFGGRVGNTVKWLFGHVEYRPDERWTANLGGYAEHNTLSGGTFSPRLGLNTRLTPNQTLRAVYSRGTRAPDLFEQRANWVYTLTDLSPPVAGSTSQKLAWTAHSPGGLSSERISSRELGYMFTHAPMGLAIDAKVFDDRLTQLISDRLFIQDFAPANIGSVRLTGAELQTSWEWSPKWSGMLNYAYLLNRHPSSSVETMQYERHSGMVGLSHLLGEGWRTSLAFYGASGNGMHESSYGRTDLVLSRQFMLGAKPSSVSLVVSYLHNRVVSTYQHEGVYFTTSYTDPLSLRGVCRMAF